MSTVANTENVDSKNVEQNTSVETKTGLTPSELNEVTPLKPSKDGSKDKPAEETAAAESGDKELTTDGKRDRPVEVAEKDTDAGTDESPPKKSKEDADGASDEKKEGEQAVVADLAVAPAAPATEADPAPASE